jgi:ketopantoate reductase
MSWRWETMTLHTMCGPERRSCWGESQLQLLDGRAKTPRQSKVLYKAKIIESFSPADAYELVIVSVRHYQLDLVQPILKDTIGEEDVLIFNGNWAGF